MVTGDNGRGNASICDCISGRWIRIFISSPELNDSARRKKGKTHFEKKLQASREEAHEAKSVRDMYAFSLKKTPPKRCESFDVRSGI